jgi:hypothetical protein
MAFSSTITVADLSSTNINFSETGRDLSQVKRIDDSTTLDLPRMLIIKHSSSKVKNETIDRHLVQLSVAKRDANGVEGVGICNFTVSVPRNGVVTATDIRELVQMLAVWANGSSQANVVALLRGEM